MPAPKAFGFGLASDANNKAGVNYIFMELLPGKLYYSHNATAAQKAHVLGQVADILIEICNHTQPKAGSFLLEDDEIVVSAVAGNRWVHLGKRGPHHTPIAYVTGIVEEYLDLIADGQLYPGLPREAFLYYSMINRHAEDLVAQDPSDAFYLRHVDDKGDHLLIDEDFNITGIIDWQFP